MLLLTTMWQIGPFIYDKLLAFKGVGESALQRSGHFWLALALLCWCGSVLEVHHLYNSMSSAQSIGPHVVSDRTCVLAATRTRSNTRLLIVGSDENKPSSAASERLQLERISGSMCAFSVEISPRSRASSDAATRDAVLSDSLADSRDASAAAARSVSVST